jgi:hypothetical protein
MAIGKEKRKRIEGLVLEVFKTLDRTGGNHERYKAFFASMDDKAFDLWCKRFLNDPEENFYLEVLPYKSEPHITDIKKAADILGVPLEERLTLRHQGGVKTPHPVPVGYLMLKRHQQIVSKKNQTAGGIKQRNQKTGQRYQAPCCRKAA